MNKIDMTKVKELLKMEREMKGMGILTDSCIIRGELQMDSKAFLENFPNPIITNRDTGEFPYYARGEIDGIQFFTLLTEKEYRRLKEDDHVSEPVIRPIRNEDRAAI